MAWRRRGLPRGAALRSRRVAPAGGELYLGADGSFEYRQGGRVAQFLGAALGAWSLLGSSNWDPRSLRLNFELFDDLVQGTIGYIRENHVMAERAFEWRVLEWESALSHSSHPMIIDRLADLADIQARVLRRLMGMPDPDLAARVDGDKVILIAHELTPSVTVQLDPRHVIGIATDLGTRTSHSAILARSLDIPCVVSLGNVSETVRDGDELILDGRQGRIVIAPTEEEKEAYRQRDYLVREWEQELVLLAHLPSVTRDGMRVRLLSNIDLPGEAENAYNHGAEGVGLYRTEFLVVGRATAPGEEEQYAAYRKVAEAFPGQPVVIRTFDLGGDKFPAFLHIGREENPFLGWRAIRVCLDEPEIFRTQLRALGRALKHGDIRIMLPLVNEISEVERSRALMKQCLAELRAEGHDVPEEFRLGAMIETPAAAMLSPELARHVDFFSIGTNDLVQYTLAVDRGNSRLARLYNPFHPAVVRLIDMTARAGREAVRTHRRRPGRVASSPRPRVQRRVQSRTWRARHDGERRSATSAETGAVYGSRIARWKSAHRHLEQAYSFVVTLRTGVVGGVAAPLARARPDVVQDDHRPLSIRQQLQSRLQPPPLLTGSKCDRAITSPSSATPSTTGCSTPATSRTSCCWANATAPDASRRVLRFCIRRSSIVMLCEGK